MVNKLILLIVLAALTMIAPAANATWPSSSSYNFNFGGGCTNQMVLNFSSACPLMLQPFGA